MRRLVIAPICLALVLILVVALLTRSPSVSSYAPTSISAPPMGFNPYNHFGNTVDETVIKQVALAMSKNGMAAAGYKYVNIDDSWQGPRDGNGNLTANGLFPDGIKGVAEYVHSLGLKLGIYTSPAELSCGLHTGSKNQAKRDAMTFASWGVDYIKLDWCGAPTSDSKASAIAAQWSKAIAATKRPMLLSINAGASPSVAKWAHKSANSWRTNVDVCNSWSNRNCPDQVNYLGISDYLNSNIADNLKYIEPGRYADPDMLEVGNGGLTYYEARTNFAMWSMWSAPLLAGNDPRSMTGSDDASTILLNKALIAVDQDASARPAVKISDSNGLQVWVKPLSDGTHAVAIVNADPTNVVRPATITAAQLGLTSITSIENLWTGSNVGSMQTVAPHDTVVFKVRS